MSRYDIRGFNNGSPIYSLKNNCKLYIVEYNNFPHNP